MTVVVFHIVCFSLMNRQLSSGRQTHPFYLLPLCQSLKLTLISRVKQPPSMCPTSFKKFQRLSETGRRNTFTPVFPFYSDCSSAGIIGFFAPLCDYELFSKRGDLKHYDRLGGPRSEPGSRWGHCSGQQKEKREEERRGKERRLLLVLHLEHGGWQISLVSVKSRISACDEIEV